MSTRMMEKKSLVLRIFFLVRDKMSERSIHWSVTINNPREDDEENIADARSRGWIVEGQKEVGENGTPHYQLAVNTRIQQRFPALKKAFPRGHIEPARNVKALKQYVHKEETRIAELGSSAKYITSRKRLWELVVDVLQSGEPPKEHRILMGEDVPYWSDRFEPLKALDYACDLLIRQGYHCVETMAVNPQTRSAWKTFWQSLIVRRDLDRQTDRQPELFSQEVDIPVLDASDNQERENQSDDTSREGEDCEDYEESEGEASEGWDEGGSVSSSETDFSD